MGYALDSPLDYYPEELSGREQGHPKIRQRRIFGLKDLTGFFGLISYTYTYGRGIYDKSLIINFQFTKYA